MSPDKLLAKILKIPESETEALGYIRAYQDSKEHPWEKFINNLYLDFNIKLPQFVEDSDKQLIIGLTILICDYEIDQDTLPGTYRINIEEFGYLDEIRDVNKYLTHLFAELVTYYYQANESEKIEELEKVFLNKNHEWNWHPWVKQEEVIKLLEEYLIVTVDKAQVSKSMIPQVLSDYYTRIDKKRLENLDNYIHKSEKILNDSKGSDEQTQFYANILNEVKNGGVNLKSKYDILSYYHGVKFS